MYQQPPNQSPTPPSGPYPAGSYPQQPSPGWGPQQPSANWGQQPPPNWGQPQQQFVPPQQFTPPQPAPRKGSPLIWIIGAVVAVLVICVGGSIALVASGFGKGDTTATSVNGTVPVPTKTAHFKVGDQVKTSGWLVVINSAKTSNGDDTFSPAAGNIWVVLDITMTNLNSASQDADTLDYELRGQDGTKYDPLITDLPDLSGTVESGGKTHGLIAYEVPMAQKTFTVEFTPDVEVVAIWDVSV